MNIRKVLVKSPVSFGYLNDILRSNEVQKYALLVFGFCCSSIKIPKLLSAMMLQVRDDKKKMIDARSRMALENKLLFSLLIVGFPMV